MRRSPGLLLLLVACAHPGPIPVCPAPPESGSAAAGSAAPLPAEPSGYQQPPQAVLDVLHAPSPPQALPSPTRTTVLLVSWVDYPGIAQVAEPFLRLAGVRVEPRTRRKHDTPGGYGVAPCARSASVVDVASGRESAVALPAGGCADGWLWSADGARFAFRNTAADGVELWIGDAATGAAHRLGGEHLNPMLGSSAQWLADQKTLLVKLVPAHAGPAPTAGVAAQGPSIQESLGATGESSTYETRDTLTSRADEALFTYYATSQLATIDATTGAVTPLGAPGLYDEVDAAPDGQHVLVTAVHAPYSYVTTYDHFPHSVAVWDRAGAPHPVADLPLADRVPIHGVPVGPRDFSWRATAPATLIWAEAQDGGDWKVQVPARDVVRAQDAPFTQPPRELARLPQRYAGLDWGERPGFALMYERDDNRHWRRALVLDADAPAAAPRVLWDLSSDERYQDPGTPVYRALPTGAWVIEQDGDAIFMRGQGYSPDGDRPYLRRLDTRTRATTPMWASEVTALESFLAFSDPARRGILTWHQSPTDPPNVWQRSLAAPATPPRAVTHIPDPTPAVRAIRKRLVTYKRKDGVALSFTLYTPPGYQEGTRIPAILYAYPLDYADAKAAGQVTGSQQQFTRLRDYRLLLLAGYAIIDNASFPIVGDPKKAYDTYLDQLVEDARAAVGKAVELGVVDPDRIGVTGHSHGALMTVNLLAHTDLFRAGVATSGSYNKTLTPFGFQNERRSVWEAQKVYLEASPFFVADQLKRPLLLVHGADDANPGTTPLQAVKLFEAIRGNGGTTRLVMLPHEPHWYAAMESNEQLAYEEIRWFDQYVKNAAPR